VAVIAYAALLRGINLGDHNKIAMSALRPVITALGLSDVATYLQSGNVVFKVDSGDTTALERLVSESIEASFGLDIPVLLRSAAALRQCWTSNPYEETDESRLYFCFLDREPEAGRIAKLASHPLAAPPPGSDSFALVGRHIYMHVPNGYGRTKLSNAFFERQLGVVLTARNWRTTKALLEMTEALTKA
jgi:uncharacterized protein (DUF1697 family)